MFPCAESLRDALDELSNRCLTICTGSLIRGANSALNVSSNMHTHMFRIDEHLLKDCRYNPFRLVNTNGQDKSKLSLFFTSIRDKSRYQAADASGMYKHDGEFGRLIYDGEQFDDRYRVQVD